MSKRRLFMARRPQNRTEANDSTKNVKVHAEETNACTGDSGASARVWRVEIPGRLPGLNEYVEAERRNRFRAAKLKRDAQDWVILCIKKHMRGVHITRPVYIRYYWHEPNRRRDKSNVSGYGRKVIEDALVEAGVLQDDGWDEIEGFEDRFFLDKANPRIILEVEECLDITTNTAGMPTEKDAPASPVHGTTTNTKAMSSAAHDTGVGAASPERRARTTSRRAKTNQKRPAKRRNK